MMFRKEILAVVILAIFGACVSGGQFRLYTRNHHNVQHLENSVVALVQNENLDPGEEQDTLGQENQAYCTGFFIDPKTVVTARHCVIRTIQQARITPFSIELEEHEQVLSTVKVTTYQFYRQNPKLINYRVFDVVGVDEQTDVAILVLRPGQDDNFQRQFMCLSNQEITPGYPVSAIGHPVGSYFLLTEGIISRESFTDENGARMIASTANIFFGNSGGPLVDQNGCAMGVAHTITARQAHLGNWSDIFNVKQLLQRLHWHLEPTRF